MRLLAHHNLPLRLIRLLPRLLQAQAAAAAAAAEAEAEAARRGRADGEGGGAPRHVRVPSVPQVGGLPFWTSTEFGSARMHSCWLCSDVHGCPFARRSSCVQRTIRRRSRAPAADRGGNGAAE